MMRRTGGCFAFLFSGVLLLATAGHRAAAAGAPELSGFPCPSNAALTCVMAQLDGVRGLAFGPDGALYAVEAGHGGDGPCILESGSRVCYGPSGGVSRLSDGGQARVLSGLPSIAVNDPATPGRTGQAANGPTDIGFGPTGADDDDAADRATPGAWTTYLTIGLRNDPRLRADLGEHGAAFAQLLRIAPNGKARFIGDLGTYEIETNSDGGTIDSNPFGLLVERGSRLVVDAGATRSSASRATDTAGSRRWRRSRRAGRDVRPTRCRRR